MIFYEPTTEADRHLAARLAFDMAPDARLADLAQLVGFYTIPGIQKAIAPVMGITARGKRGAEITRLWEIETREERPNVCDAVVRTYAYLAERAQTIARMKRLDAWNKEHPSRLKRLGDWHEQQASRRA